MRLKTGQRAPVFIQRDMYEQPVSLSQYWGRKILLSFYRGAVCPLCNLRLRYLIDHYDNYRRQGLEMIVFFESSPEMARRYLERQRSPFPIIPDLERAVYSLYGLESSLLGALKARLFRGSQYREAARYHVGGGFWENLSQMDGVFSRKPADFLLSPDLRIQSAYYGRDAGDFMPFAEIDRFLVARPESLVDGLWTRPRSPLSQLRVSPIPVAPHQAVPRLAIIPQANHANHAPITGVRVALVVRAIQGGERLTSAFHDRVPWSNR